MNNIEGYHSPGLPEIQLKQQRNLETAVKQEHLQFCGILMAACCFQRHHLSLNSQSTLTARSKRQQENTELLVKLLLYGEIQKFSIGKYTTDQRNNSENIPPCAVARNAAS